MAKKKTKTKSTQTVAPSAYNQPYIDGAAQTLKPAYDEGMAVQRQFQPGLLAAGNYLGGVIGGNEVNDDPYLEGVIDSTNADVTDRVNSQMMPRFGSASYAKTLARALAENSNNLRYGALDRARQRQMQAVGLLGDTALRATALPGLPAENYAQGTAGLLGQYNTTTGTQKTTSSGGLLGTLGKIAQLAAVAAPAASDRRLKTDIEKVGEDADGLGRYRYRYVTDAPDSPLREGVMADEVAQLRPWALGPERGGFATVDYNLL